MARNLEVCCVSLTDFISTPDVRDRVTEAFPNQGQGATKSVQATWETQNYMLVGTAFDYLTRFWLRRNIPNVHSRQWVAETSLKIVEQEFPRFESDVREVIERAKDERDTYLDTGTFTRPLIESAIDLARVDGIYRSGILPENLGEYNTGDIVDCIRLVEILDSSGTLNGDTVHLNPEFHLASTLVGGADADVILDGALLDVKTSGDGTFKVGYWRQLVGYLVLADIHNRLYNMGIYDQLDSFDESEVSPLPDITEFGVYFSRHGDLSTVSASVVYDAEGYPEFRSWFAERAMTDYETLPESLQNVLNGIL